MTPRLSETPNAVPFPVRNIAQTDEDSVIFYADFETSSGMNNWTPADLTNPGPTWHADTYNAYSGHSWWSGKSALMGYDNNWLQYLVTPPIDLSGSASPELNFDLYWAVESPSPYLAYDGWDGCNVWVWNGYIWTVIEPEYPTYACQNLYSFGWRWGMGEGVPGWAGSSGGWTSARFDLSNYTLPNVRLRFAFCSDADICTASNPGLQGFFVDNVEVREGSTLYLSNNGEGGGFPGEFTYDTGEPYGNFWVLSADEYHSSAHSWNCDDRFLLSDALTSPPIEIPAGMSTQMSYWVYCDMPDVDGDNDDYLDDYYYIEVAPVSDAVWIPLAYDWAANGSQFQWVERTNGVWESIPTPNLDLTPWAGQTVRIRFRVVTDDNNDGGQSDGLYIDDVLLLSHALPDHDVGATRLMIPFPTYAGQTSVSCSCDLVNYGTLNQQQVPAFWSVGGTATALIPWSSIASGDSVRRTFAWTPPAEGSYPFGAYTQLTDDEDHSNDSCSGGIVEVTPAGFFEFGYDHRQITYLPDFYSFNFPQGSGPLVRFTPAADGVPGFLYGNTIRAMFYTAGTFHLHIFADGSAGLPGAEVYDEMVTIASASIYPNWADIDISNVPYLQGGHPNFWVWLEITSADNTPHPTGHLLDAFTSGHFFTFDGAEADPTIVNFNVRATLTGSAGVGPDFSVQPTVLSLRQNYPNPFNNATTIQFTLPAPAEVELGVYDLVGRRVAQVEEGRMPAGEQQIRWEAKALPSGSYWLRLQVNKQIKTQRMVLLK